MNTIIPIELLEKPCHDLLVQPGSAIDQRNLSPRQLAAQVRRLTAAPADWVTRVRLDAEGRWYERIQAGDVWEVWLISWLPGQSTGFHDHGGSAGAFGVVWGALDECFLQCGSGPLVNRVSSGEVRAFGAHHVHDVRNSADSSVAVSLHAYSPPLSTMTRYDLTPSGLAMASTEGAADW
jgi:predicted metal-dependent enzyme (double-stranded beta helix superfamily)